MALVLAGGHALGLGGGGGGGIEVDRGLRGTRVGTALGTLGLAAGGGRRGVALLLAGLESCI